MPKQTKQHLILWAIDPYSGEHALLRQTASAVRLLASQWDAEVEPVYLLQGFPANVRLLPELIEDIRLDAQKTLERLIRGMHGFDLLPVHLLTDDLPTYALQVKADAIALGTRARKGLKRWFTGSFAEKLMMNVSVPLYIINPGEMTPKRIQHLLFPTDFSEESKKAYLRVLSLASELDAEVTLFHKLKYEITPPVDVALVAYPAYRDTFQDEIKARKQDAESWARMGRAMDVPVEPVVDFRLEGSVVDAIHRQIKERGGIIAMAGHSGRVASALLGSVTRQVIRSASCPVWVIHTPPVQLSSAKQNIKMLPL